jgi:hypothetical protein
MISKTTIAAALIALTSFAAVPANALTIDFHTGGMNDGWSGGPRHGRSDDNWSGGYSDHRDHWRHRLSRQEVRWILRERGYRNIRFFDDQGPVYQIRARKRGDTYFLVVSKRNGEIIARNRV